VVAVRDHRSNKAVPSVETSPPLQTKFPKVILRQRHVRDLVARLCHQDLKGNPHGGSGYAELPQERSEWIKATYLGELEDPRGVPAEAEQILRRFISVLATFNVDHTACAVVAVSVDVSHPRSATLG
jgi:hypothetical protein